MPKAQYSARISSSQPSIFVLMGFIGVARFRTVHAAPALVVVVVGTAIAITEGVGSTATALPSLAMTLIYVFWYSLNGRQHCEALTIGKRFPDISLTDLGGAPISSESWHGSPTILLFYRGAWCPLCSVQVKELAADYREIEAKGAKVVLVSPQPAKDSRNMASRFDAPMTFLVDEDNAAARALGLQHPGGAPLGVVAEGETVLPTAVVLDAGGIVRFAHETDNYRVRPDPALFLEVLSGLTPNV